MFHFYTDKILDSTKVLVNSFELKSSIDSSPIKGFLYSRDFKNYKFSLLKNNEILFDSSKKTFKEVEVSARINTLNIKRKATQEYNKRIICK
jgi:hypothetical protein